jgi:hypothetical protein
MLKHALVGSETRWSEGHAKQASGKKKNRNSSKACQTSLELKLVIALTKPAEAEAKGTRADVCRRMLTYADVC